MNTAFGVEFEIQIVECSLTKKKQGKCKWHNYWMHANYRHNSRICTRRYPSDEMKNVMNEYLSLGHTDVLSGAPAEWKMEKKKRKHTSTALLIFISCVYCVCAILVYGLNRLNGETPVPRLSAMRIISVLAPSSVSFRFASRATGMHCHSMWNLFKIWLRCDTIESKSFACSTLVFAILSLGAFFLSHRIRVGSAYQMPRTRLRECDENIYFTRFHI